MPTQSDLWVSVGADTSSPSTVDKHRPLYSDPRVQLTRQRLWQDNVQEGLVSLNEAGQPVLMLLESCSVSSDALGYRMELRKQRFFHDDSEVTAASVISCLRRVVALGAKSTTRLDLCLEPGPSGMKRLSRYRFEVRLREVMAGFLERLAHPECAITKLAHAEMASAESKKGACTEEPSQQLVNCGPYRPHLFGPTDHYPVDHADANADANLNTKDSLELRLYDKHPLADKLPFRVVRVGEFSPEQWWDHAVQTQPTLLLYAGSQIKRHPEKSLALPEETGMVSSLFLAFSAKAEPKIRRLRAALLATLKAAFREHAQWRRSELTAFLPEGHVLHSPFAQTLALQEQAREQKLQADADKLAKQAPTHLSVAAETIRLVPKRLFERWQKVCAQEGLTLVQEQDLAKAEVCFVQPPLMSSYDVLTPISWLLRNSRLIGLSGRNVRAFSAALLKVQKKQRLEELRRLFATLLQHSRLIPVASIPQLLFTNQRWKGKGHGSLRLSLLERGHAEQADLLQRDKDLMALGRAVKMFAHDFKRPLSLAQSLVAILEHVSDPQDMQTKLTRYAPELKRSIQQVHAMIADVMEFGGSAPPLRESTVLEHLIEISLAERFRHTPSHRQVRLSYELGHTRQVHVDNLKMLRVLGNIIANADEAMQKHADPHMWFHTQDAAIGGTDFVRLTIGNAGSYISRQEREMLFQAFYTRGKRAGSGFGLAICAKILQAHGGRISCSSDKCKGTEFHLMLPASISRSGRLDDGLSLPESSLAIQQRFAQDLRATRPLPAVPLKERLPSEHSSNPRPYEVLIVDDEPVYINLIDSGLRSEGFDGSQVNLSIQLTSEGCLKAAGCKHYDLIILDVNLGKHSADGLETLRLLRTAGIDTPVCLHSNQDIEQMRGGLVGLSRWVFLPKPMTAVQLMDMLGSLPVGSAQDATKLADPPKDGHGSQSTQAELIQQKQVDQFERREQSEQSERSTACPKYLWVDDDEFWLDMWEDRLGQSLLTFSDPQDFWAYIDSLEGKGRPKGKDLPQALNEIQAICVDSWFKSSEVSGEDIIRTLRKRGLSLPLFLVTNRSASEVALEVRALCTGIVEKEVEAVERALSLPSTGREF